MGVQGRLWGASRKRKHPRGGPRNFPETYGAFSFLKKIKN